MSYIGKEIKGFQSLMASAADGDADLRSKIESLRREVEGLPKALVAKAEALVAEPAPPDLLDHLLQALADMAREIEDVMAAHLASTRERYQPYSRSIYFDFDDLLVDGATLFRDARWAVMARRAEVRTDDQVLMALSIGDLDGVGAQEA